MEIKKGVGLVAGIFIIILMAACSDSPNPPELTRIVDQAGTPVTTETATTSAAKPTARPTQTPIIIIDDFGPPPTPDPRITINDYLADDIPTLDPQLAEGTVSNNYIENLFVQLTNFDLVTTEIVPETATSWEISEDGRLYTFHLRTDIPWVYHNPVTEETTREIDQDGNPRFVTAYDFAYGIRRGCYLTGSSFFSQMVTPLIAGCAAVLDADDPDSISDVLLAPIGVNALDEATLTIELNEPTDYFLSLTAMPAFSAVPSWTIKEYGEDWIEAGNIVTNGRFVLNLWVHNVWVILVRNPLMPAEMQGSGNIEVHNAWVIPVDDNDISYALWLNYEIDVSIIPDDEVESHLVNFADQLIRVPDPSLFYIGYRTTAPPFDNVHVRRAFSAAIDREKFVTDILQGQGLPMKHFPPSGIIDAPPIDDIGVGFDPEFARAEMEAAGYPDCQSFPPVTLMTKHGQITREWLEFAQTEWQTHLGCNADLFSLRRVTASRLEANISLEIDNSDAPHLWFLSWESDYDGSNKIGDLLGCNSGLNFEKRSCNETDDLLFEASHLFDFDRQIELYYQIETAFFGSMGEYPIIPIFSPTLYNYYGVRPWYNYTPALFAGDQWYNYSIDQEAKQAARN